MVAFAAIAAAAVVGLAAGFVPALAASRRSIVDGMKAA
jgi:hypothetical protein